MLTLSSTERQTFIKWTARFGATDGLRHRHTLPEEYFRRRATENSTLDGKKNILFTLTEKENHLDWWNLDLFKSQKTHLLLRRTGTTFLSV